MGSDDWPTFTVSEITSKGRNALVGGPFGSDLVSKDYVPSGVPVIRGANMGKGRWVSGDFVFVSKEKADSLSANCAKPGDLVFTQRGTIGQVALVPEAGFDRYLISQSQMKLSVDPDKVSGLFLFYVFCTTEQQNYIQQNAIRTGVPHTNLGILRNTPVRLPPLIKQNAIASVLTALDAKIELNQRINAELEGMAKLLYDYWFVQFDFPMTTAQAAALGKPHPYRASGGKMIYNETLKREIPEGWTVQTLSQCIDRIIDHRGKTPNKLGGDWSTQDDAIIALSARVVKGGKLIGIERANKVDRELYEKWMPTKLMDGDILMTSEAPAGEFYFIHGKTEYCLSQRLFAIRADQTKVLPAYLYHELSTGHAYSEIMGSLSGSTVFGIRQDVLREIKVVVPNKQVQEKFEETAIPLLRSIKLHDEQNQELTQLRDWLLPMLMNGQVRVG